MIGHWNGVTIEMLGSLGLEDHHGLSVLFGLWVITWLQYQLSLGLDGLQARPLSESWFLIPRRDQNFSLQWIRTFPTPAFWTTVTPSVLNHYFGPINLGRGIEHSYDFAFWFYPGQKEELWRQLEANVHWVLGMVLLILLVSLIFCGECMISLHPIFPSSMKEHVYIWVFIGHLPNAHEWLGHCSGVFIGGKEGKGWDVGVDCRTLEPKAIRNGFLKENKLPPLPQSLVIILLWVEKNSQRGLLGGKGSSTCDPMFCLFLPPGCHHCHALFLWLECRLDPLSLAPIKNKFYNILNIREQQKGNSHRKCKQCKDKFVSVTLLRLTPLP